MSGIIEAAAGFLTLAVSMQIVGASLLAMSRRNRLQAGPNDDHLAACMFTSEGKVHCMVTA
jgi:hypothetical protein